MQIFVTVSVSQNRTTHWSCYNMTSGQCQWQTMVCDVRMSETGVERDHHLDQKPRMHTAALQSPMNETRHYSCCVFVVAVVTATSFTFTEDVGGMIRLPLDDYRQSPFYIPCPGELPTSRRFLLPQTVPDLSSTKEVGELILG